MKVFRIGVGERKLACNARILGCDVGSFPFNYLGVVVRANMNLIKNWKLTAHISVIESLEKICRRFLWGGTDKKRKILWVAWPKVLA
uniref:Uncharacterized protein n=1 Tax=Lactuca sativa TaxID=4236 RepID=A0A9R1UG27_LACSA|nr:hypothetical protein LSAT_V11C900480590 [Lactuca sativa]